MSLDSFSSYVDDSSDLNRNSDLKPVGERFGLLTLTEPVELEPFRGNGDEIANESLNWERNDGDEEDDRLIVENREIFGDEKPSSPSSSAYAGERGSSSATSGSRIDEASEIEGNEIQEVRNDGFLEGFSDTQASHWIPDKRHDVEIRKKKNRFNLFFAEFFQF